MIVLTRAVTTACRLHNSYMFLCIDSHCKQKVHYRAYASVTGKLQPQIAPYLAIIPTSRRAGNRAAIAQNVHVLAGKGGV